MPPTMIDCPPLTLRGSAFACSESKQEAEEEAGGGAANAARSEPCWLGSRFDSGREGLHWRR